MKKVAHTLRVEKSPANEKWDSRGHRTLRELPIFFPAWSEHENLRAFSTELFWVHAGEAVKSDIAELEKSLAQEILGDPLFNVSAQESSFPGEARKGFRWWCLEKGLRAGVTDNAGHVLSEALELVTGK